MCAKTLLGEGVILRKEKKVIFGEFLFVLSEYFLPCVVAFIIRRNGCLDVSLVFFSDDFGSLEYGVTRN